MGESIVSTGTGLADRLGRKAGVLRLSLTARCNLACVYCRPDRHDPPGLLSRAERVLLVGVAAGLGWQRLRLTGGEPLLVPDLDNLIAEVTALGVVHDIALTSNGVLLDRARAFSLRQAGLHRITLSLDGADPRTVQRMGGGNSFHTVMQAVDHGIAAGLQPKINMVVMAHRNGDEVIPMAQLCRERHVELRLIEYMDVGNRNGWQREHVLPAATMVQRIGNRWPLTGEDRQPGSTARRWRYDDGAGFVSTIASISEPFCGDCNRLRITADGMAYTCLFASEGTDLKPALRDPQPVQQLQHLLRQLWQRRDDRYSEQRPQQQREQHRRPAEMAYIGG